MQNGQVSMDIQGQTYTLLLDTNAMVKLEALFSTPQREMTFFEILARVQKDSITHFRGLIWASLQKHHPDLTVERVGELIQAVGGLALFGKQLEALAQSASPDPADVQELGIGGNGNPRTAQGAKVRGIGGRSRSAHAVSA